MTKKDNPMAHRVLNIATPIVARPMRYGGLTRRQPGLVHSLGVFLVLLAGCASTPSSPQVANGLIVSATFGTDGRLWRVRAGEQHVYVDHSTDRGMTFSSPTAVGAKPQRIRAFSEDRPSIAVDSQGKIYVAYFAEGAQPLMIYFSYSSDGGKTFSTPVLVSDQAQSARHYQAKLAVSPLGQAYLFWNDKRDTVRDGQAALYYASTDNGEGVSFSNRKLKDSMCECCRLAVDFDKDGLPVLLGRFIFPVDVRDHGMLKVSSVKPPWRVTHDDWRIEACPEHGPSLAIAEDGRYHIAWFTQGARRKGLFYAHSDNQGQTFSRPLPFGNRDALAGHPDLLALGRRVHLVWQEFDGVKTTIMMMRSKDGGNSWSGAIEIAHASGASDYPFLISDGEVAYLSWNTSTHGYSLIRIE